LGAFFLLKFGRVSRVSNGWCIGGCWVT
jgi:hypothetical protein